MQSGERQSCNGWPCTFASSARHRHPPAQQFAICNSQFAVFNLQFPFTSPSRLLSPGTLLDANRHARVTACQPSGPAPASFTVGLHFDHRGHHYRFDDLLQHAADCPTGSQRHMVDGCMDSRRGLHGHRRSLLCGDGHRLSQSGRRLCLLDRGLWTQTRIPIRLEPVLDYPAGIDRHVRLYLCAIRQPDLSAAPTVFSAARSRRRIRRRS